MKMVMKKRMKEKTGLWSHELVQFKNHHPLSSPHTHHLLKAQVTFYFIIILQLYKIVEF